MLPLAGIKVIEIAQNLSGPYAAEILATLGADVLKVERPGGDDARGWGPPFTAGASTTFQTVNRNKRSVTLDLTQPPDRDRLHALVAEADVLVQNLRPGSLDALGFDAASLRAAHPRLVYCSVWAFGAVGPMRNTPGYEPIVQAFSGLFGLNGSADAPPARVGVQVLDLGTGLWAALGCVAALHRRTATGEGAVVDTSLLETAMGWMSVSFAGFAKSGVLPIRHRSGNPKIVVFEALPTADAELVVAAANDRLFAKLCHALGQPGWAADPRYATNASRVNHKAEIIGAIGAVHAHPAVPPLVRRVRRRGHPVCPDQRPRRAAGRPAGGGAGHPAAHPGPRHPHRRPARQLRRRAARHAHRRPAAGGARCSHLTCWPAAARWSPAAAPGSGSPSAPASWSSAPPWSSAAAGSRCWKGAADALRETHPGADITTIGCDIRDPAQVEAMLDTIWQARPLDILVNNAAGNFLAQSHRLSTRAVDAVLGIVLHGSAYCTLGCGRRWIAEGRPGTVLSVLTLSALTGAAFTLPSAMAKAGVLAMTRSLAVEWGPKGIRCVAVAPRRVPHARRRCRAGTTGPGAAAGHPHRPARPRRPTCGTDERLRVPGVGPRQLRQRGLPGRGWRQAPVVRLGAERHRHAAALDRCAVGTRYAPTRGK